MPPPASGDATTTLPLTAAMRKATRRDHHAANALILAKLAVALNDRTLYARALASFHPVYTELERLLERHRAHTALGPVAAAALPLRRARAMEEDLDYLMMMGSGGSKGGGGSAGDGGGGDSGVGDGKKSSSSSSSSSSSKNKKQQAAAAAAGTAGWRWAAAASVSAAEYAAHLRALAEEDPALLIPYAWSLYVPVTLGFMGQRVARGLGVPSPGGSSGAAASPSPSTPAPLPSAGVRFFDLAATAGIADARQALETLRGAVDSAGARMPAEKRARLCVEARQQFALNNRVVREFPLGARDVARTVLLSWRALVVVGAVVVGLVAVWVGGGGAVKRR
jgi:heme oxygenase